MGSKEQDEGLTWIPTMDLRFVERKFELSKFYQPNTVTKRILQQRFVSGDQSEWRDIPLVTEPANV